MQDLRSEKKALKKQFLAATDDEITIRALLQLFQNNTTFLGLKFFLN